MIKKILKFVFHRLFLVALMMLLQLAVVVVVIWKFQEYFLWFYLINLILSLLVMLYIINGKDNPGYKIAWLIPVLTIPIFGTIFYLMFGGNKLDKKTKKKIAENKEKKKKYLLYDEAIYQQLKEENKEAYLQSQYLLNYAYYPIYQNTEVEYLKIGEECYERMIQELKKAKKYIFIEYFIVTEGKFWNSILEILKEKVKQGVEVRVLYDDMGCIYTLPSKYYKNLETYGIKCSTFNRFVPVLSAKLNNRDHRKIMVIDGVVGFTGGINLADEYMNIGSKYGHWKDNGIVLKGEAVWSLAIIFLSTWNYIHKGNEDLECFKPKYDHKNNDGYIIPYDDSPLDFENVGENVYLSLINRAKDYIYIMTPYLILDNEMVTALCLASKNGIDVQIITPGIADKKMINEVTKAYYEQLLENKVKIFEYDPGFVHAKTVIVDDIYAVVGTINMDYRSLYLHFENGVWMYKTSCIKDIKKDYKETLQKCHEVSIKESRRIKWLRGLKRGILRLFAPLM